MQESARAALSHVRQQAVALGIVPDVLSKQDLHIHVPAGAIPKDGPSAGVTMATAIVSAARGMPVRADVAMTGEITLSGLVLPVGGIREKALAARRQGIKTIVLPEGNMPGSERAARGSPPRPDVRAGAGARGRAARRNTGGGGRHGGRRPALAQRQRRRGCREDELIALAFYISGHGFGHASRQIEIINALGVRRPDVHLLVRTTVAALAPRTHAARPVSSRGRTVRHRDRADRQPAARCARDDRRGPDVLCDASTSAWPERRRSCGTTTSRSSWPTRRPWVRGGRCRRHPLRCGLQLHVGLDLRGIP